MGRVLGLAYALRRVFSGTSGRQMGGTRCAWRGMESLEGRRLLSAVGIDWGSYLGGAAVDDATAVAVDAAGNRYVTGSTGSTNFPATGGLDSTYGGDETDAFVAKVGPSGQLLWATYIGGNGYDWGYGIAVDGGGNVLVTGTTTSTDLPISGGFQSTLAGGKDAFLVKLNGNGQRLWSTYLGGADADEGFGIALDGLGNVLLTGTTKGAGFPASGGYDSSFNGGVDAFVAKVSTSGQLLWSSFLGGVSSDYGQAVAVDGGGNVLVTGRTQSEDFPASGAFDTSHNGGYDDAFIAKFNASGQRLWSGFLGGSGSDYGQSIAVDRGGNALVAGWTASSNLPAQGGGDRSFGGVIDGFVAKVSPAGALAWCSYFGGSNEDYLSGIALDGSGNAVVAGYAKSTDVAVPGGFDASFNGGSSDAVVASINSSGQLLWSSFLGGSGNDYGQAVTVSSAGRITVAGTTYSSNMPVPSGFDTSFNGGFRDVFLTGLSDSVSPQASLSAEGVPLAGGSVYNFTVTYSDNLAVDASMLGSGDILVTGPVGFSQVAAFDGADGSGDGTPITAHYHITTPGGVWDVGDNGTYTVALQAGQVKDISGNLAAGGVLGTFQVSVSNGAQAAFGASYNDIAYDASGRLHLAYYDATEYKVKYAVRSAGGVWSSVTVVPDNGADVGQFLSLAVDSNGHPGISYYDAWNADLKYAYFDGSQWTVQAVDSYRSVGMYTSIGFDGRNHPVISYYAKAGGDLRVAAFDGSTWTISTVDSADDCGRHSSLALNPVSGRWAVAYEDTTTGAYRFAQQSRRGWDLATAANTLGGGGYVSLAFDGLGNPAFSYYDAYWADLKFAHFNGSAWDVQLVASKGVQGMYTSLFYSGSTAHILYFSRSANAAYEAQNAGGSWSASLLRSGGGRCLATALGPSGQESFSWLDAVGLRVEEL